jgi:hypothetical protein
VIKEFVESLDPSTLMLVSMVICFGFLMLCSHYQDTKYLRWTLRIAERSKFLNIILMFCVLYFPIFGFSLLLKYF